MKIKVSIIEDLVEVATMLSEIINDEEDMECTQVYHNAEDAITFIPKNPPDIIIVDIGLPRASGLDAINVLNQECPGILFCMFTVYEDDEKIFNSLRAGAKGYILKGSDPEKIISSIRELNQGGSPMSNTIARRILDVFQQLPAPQKPISLPLTTREIEILDLMSKGLLYKEISDQLGITIGTVKQHIHKIYDKLQVNNKIEALNKMKSI